MSTKARRHTTCICNFTLCHEGFKVSADPCVPSLGCKESKYQWVWWGVSRTLPHLSSPRQHEVFNTTRAWSCVSQVFIMERGLRRQTINLKLFLFIPDFPGRRLNERLCLLPLAATHGQLSTQFWSFFLITSLPVQAHPLFWVYTRGTSGNPQ